MKHKTPFEIQNAKKCKPLNYRETKRMHSLARLHATQRATTKQIHDLMSLREQAESANADISDRR